MNARTTEVCTSNGRVFYKDKNIEWAEPQKRHDFHLLLEEVIK